MEVYVITCQWGNDVYYLTNDAGIIGHLEETKFDFLVIEYTRKYLLNIQKTKLKIFRRYIHLFLSIYRRENFAHVFQKRYKSVYYSILIRTVI